MARSKQKQKKQKQQSNPPPQAAKASQASIESVIRRLQDQSRVADLRAARIQLNPFSRSDGSKWTDDNAARSVAMRTRTLSSPPINGTYPTIAFAVTPALAEMLYIAPALGAAETINTTWAASPVNNVAYASLITEAAFYRIVGWGFRLTVVEAALTAQGVITVQTLSGANPIVANANSLPGTRSDQTEGKQTYAFSAGQVIEWFSKPTDNVTRHYAAPGSSFDGSWEACAVWCTGLSATAKVELEVRMDLEVLPSKGKVLNYSVTNAAPYKPGVLAAVADYASSTLNSTSVMNAIGAAAMGTQYLFSRNAARFTGGGAAPAA